MNDGKYFFTTPATIKSSFSKKYKTYEVTGYNIEVDEKGHPTQNGFDQTASLMKLYCDTDYESARYLFIDKNGKIIRHLAYSNGVPNSTRPYPGEKELNEIRSYAQKNDCSIVFLHNHPNGYVEPSRADIQMTERMESLLADNSGTRRFAGHIILDTGSDTYGFYDSNYKNWEIRYDGQNHNFDEYYSDIKSKKLKICHDADPDRKTIFFRIEDDRTPKFLSEIEKAYSKDEWNKDEWIPLFYLKEYGVLEHLEYIHKNSFKDYESLDKRIRDTATKTGTTRCFMLPKNYELTVECSRYASKKEQGKDKGIIESVYFANGSDSILKRYKHSIFDGYNTDRMKIIDDSLDFPFGINMKENITKEKDIKSENIITADILQMIASKTTIWGISQQKAENLIDYLTENKISLYYDPDSLNISASGSLSGTQLENKEIITLKDIESFYSNKSVQFQTLKGEPNMKENIEKESVRQNDAGLKASSISGTGSSEMDYRVALAHEIKINMPNLSDGERAAAISILEAGAVSMDMKLSDYVKQTFPNGIFGNFQEAELSARQQGKLINGGVVIDGFGENAKAVIYASRTADFSTWVHEVAHIWQAQLTGKLKQNAEKAFNVENGDWKNSKYVFADGHEDTCGEAFAYGFEDILKNADSEFNTPEKQKIYKKFASYMSRTYNGLEKNIKINDDIKKVYDAFCLVDNNLLSQAEKAVKLEMNYVPAETTEHQFASKQIELQYQIVGENSIRSMSKSMERNRILSNLTAAVYLDENLKNLNDASKASRIRIETGWEKDKTGKWKYETDDSVSRIKNGSSFEKLISTNPKLLTKLTEGDKKLTLNDILDSPELFSIFPFMKDINIRFYDDPDTYRALLDSDGIMINTHYLDAVNGEKGLKGILAHEIQHIIQAAEYNQKQDMTGENLELLYMNTMQKMREEGKRFYDYDTNSVDFGIEKYMKDAGEIEARNVARRIAFSDSERRHKTLRSTEEMMNKIQFQARKIIGIKPTLTLSDNIMEWLSVEYPEQLNSYFSLTKKYNETKNANSKEHIKRNIIKTVKNITDNYELQVERKWNKSKFSKQINNILNATDYNELNSDYVCFGFTPSLYSPIGYNSIPLFMSADHVYSCINKDGFIHSSKTHYHNLGRNNVENIPYNLDNVILILRSVTHPESIVCILDYDVPLVDKKTGNQTSEITKLQLFIKPKKPGLKITYSNFINEGNILATAFDLNTRIRPESIIYFNKDKESQLKQLTSINADIAEVVHKSGFDIYNISRYHDDVKNILKIDLPLNYSLLKKINENLSKEENVSISSNEIIQKTILENIQFQEIKQKTKENKIMDNNLNLEKEYYDIRTKDVFGETQINKLSESINNYIKSLKDNKNNISPEQTKEIKNKYKEFKKVLKNYNNISNDLLSTQGSIEEVYKSLIDLDDYRNYLISYENGNKLSFEEYHKNEIKNITRHYSEKINKPTQDEYSKIKTLTGSDLKKDFIQNLKEAKSLQILDSEFHEEWKDFSKLYEDRTSLRYTLEQKKEINQFVLEYTHTDSLEKALPILEKKVETEIQIDNGAAWEYNENHEKVLKENSSYHVIYNKNNEREIRYDNLKDDIIHALSNTSYKKGESFREFFDRVTNERYNAIEKEQLDSILEKITGVSGTLDAQERVTQIFKNLEDDINGRKFGPEVNGDLLTKSFEQLTEKYNSEDIHPAQKELFRKYFDEKVQEELGNKIHEEKQSSDELAKIVQTRFITDDISNRILNGKPLVGKDGDQQISLNSIDDVVKYIQSNPQRFERSEWIYGNDTDKIKQADKERSVEKQKTNHVLEKIARWDYDYDDGDQSWPEYSEVYFDKNNSEFILKKYEGYNDTWDESKITPEELLEKYNDAKRLNGYKNHKIIQELNENFVKSFITQEKQNIPSISDVEKEVVSDPESSSHSDEKVSDELKFTKTPEFEKPAEDIQVEDFDSNSSKTDPEKEEPVINKRQLSYSDFLIEASKLETPEAYEKFFNENFNFQIANFKPIPPIADNKLQLFIDGKATDKVFNDNIEEKRSWARWCFDKGMAMYVPLPEVVKKNGMEVIKKSISICNNLLNTDITREAEAKEQSQEAAEQKKDNEPGASIIGPQLYAGSEWTEEELKLIRHVEIDKIPSFIKDPYMDDIAVPKFTTAFRDPETGEYTMKEQSGWHFAQKMTEHGAVTAIMLTKINDSGVREFLKIEPTQYEAMINRGKELVQEWSEPRFKNTHLQALYKYENDIGISKHETRTNTCGQYFHNFEALCRGSSDGRPPADNEEQAMKYAKEIYMKMSPHEKRRMHKMEKEFLKVKGYTIEEELMRRFYEVQKERVFSQKELELPGHSDESLVNGISVEDGKIRGELDDVSHTKVGDTIRISLTTKNFNGKELRMPVTDMKVVAANKETNTVCLIDEQKNTRYELPLDKFISHRQEVTRKLNMQQQKDNRQAAKIEARQKKKETEDYSFGI